MITQCQRCDKNDNNVIFRCGMAICEDCGYEITVERHFANLMANAILCEKKDGLDRTDYRERIAVAYLSANTNGVDDDYAVRTANMI